MSKGKKKDQDLTRIENLSEFNHEDDTEIDRLFESFNTQTKKSSSKHSDENADENTDEDSYSEEEGSRIYNLDELEDSDEKAESSDHFESSENYSDADTEYTEDSDYQSNENESESEAFEFSSESNSLDDSLADQDENNFDYNSESLETAEFESDSSSESEELTSFDEIQSNFPPPLPEEIEIFENENEDEYEDESTSEAENFIDSTESIFQESSSEVSNHYSDVNQFGNNITPNEHLSQVANPPYSIAIENIQFEEDARELKKILENFEIISPANESDYVLAIKNGRVLVPQVSEYKAIMLGHALRKFNFSIQVGLSHQVFPQSNETEAFKGLISKKFAHQNLREEAKKRELTFEIQDIQMTSLSDIPNFTIEQLHDVKTIMTVISKDELERLSFVESALRENIFSNSPDYETSFNQNYLNDVQENETLKAYQSYQKSFEHLFDDMTNRLREDAYTQGHNAVIGINFQINPIINEHDNQISSYTITCSATFATVTKRS